MKMRAIFTIVALMNLVGCATAVIPGAMGPPGDRLMMNAMDASQSAVSPEQSQALIIVTISQELHDDLTEGRGISPAVLAAEGMPQPYKDFLDEFRDKFGLTRIADWPLRSLGARCLVFRMPSQASRDEITAALANDPRIEIVQPLNLFRVLGSEYNDPYWDFQHGPKSMQIGLSHRWATGNGVTVAVVDTGIDIAHPDLQGQFKEMRNFIDRDSAAFRTELHGTAVAGVIAAATNNEVGMVGIAPDSQLLALRACWQTSPGLIQATCSSFTLSKAIDFAIARNVDVINLSLAGPPDPLLAELVDIAIGKGISVVGAVNPGKSGDFPAYIDGVIAVTEASENTRNSGTSLAAPGAKILSMRPKGEYDFFSGSSMSAAHVSGLIALIRERRPHISPEDTQALLKTASGRVRGTRQSTGAINACLVLAQLVGGQC